MKGGPISGTKCMKKYLFQNVTLENYCCCYVVNMLNKTHYMISACFRDRCKSDHDRVIRAASKSKFDFATPWNIPHNLCFTIIDNNELCFQEIVKMTGYHIKQLDLCNMYIA